MELRKEGPKFCFDQLNGMSLKELQTLLPILIKKCGVKSTIQLDGGYNNVCVYLNPTKKIKEKK